MVSALGRLTIAKCVSGLDLFSLKKRAELIHPLGENIKNILDQKEYYFDLNKSLIISFSTSEHSVYLTFPFFLASK